ncbi:MAG: BatA domain-containing protein, partial [Myxococcota bacterium]
MGFATPLALLLGLLIAGPIIAHLRRQRRLPVHPLPTLRLLEKALAEQRRRFVVRDRALLVLRILAVLAVALAVAGPFFWTDAAFGDGRATSLTVVLDDSASMETVFEDAQDRAIATLDALDTDSRITVVAAGAPARVLGSELSVAAARSLIREQRVSDRSTDLVGAARAARGSASMIPRLLVLSDFPAGQETEWPRIESAFEVLRESGPNRALLEAESIPDPTRGGALSLRVRAFGPPGTAEVRAFDEEGELLARADLTFDDVRQGTLTLALPAASGPLRVELEAAEGEGRLRDNTRWLAAASSGQQVLIVEGLPATQSSRYLQRALRLVPNVGGQAIAPRVVDETRVA